MVSGGDLNQLTYPYCLEAEHPGDGGQPEGDGDQVDGDTESSYRFEVDGVGFGAGQAERP